jgi:putative transposase
MTLFRSRGDFESFQRCLVQTLQTIPMRLLAFCVMPNHWHLVLWPQRDGDLARFMLRLTITHVRRWLIHRHQVGTGHVYQGRYKSFAIQDDVHLTTVCRYVERNPLRAKLVASARNWLWSSAGQSGLPAELRATLSDSPVPRRKDWIQWVDRPQTLAEEQAVRRSIAQNRPYGDDLWMNTMKRKLRWREPLKRGRPKKRRNPPESK